MKHRYTIDLLRVRCSIEPASKEWQVGVSMPLVCKDVLPGAKSIEVDKEEKHSKADAYRFSIKS